MCDLFNKIVKKSAKVGVIGLGYVGLPLAVEKAKAGFHVLGFDKLSFVLLMVAAALSYMASFAGNGMTAARYFRSQLPLFVIVTIITTIAAALLIPKLGLIGAALAVILSNFAQLIGSMYIVDLALHRLKGGRQ